MSHAKVANHIRKTNLTAYELEVVSGCLIGDGSLQVAGKHYRLRIEHTVSCQEYVQWKYGLLQRICITPSRYTQAHESYRFGTIGHPDITRMRQKWYQPYKRIASNFRLTPLMLAIWFMDDGTKHRDTVNFSVHNFHTSSIEVLQKQLKDYDVETTINFDAKGSRLYVLRRSFPTFEKLVKPYMVQCMTYKLP